MTTIFALSSGTLPCGVAVLRISGPHACDAALALTAKPLPSPRFAALRSFNNPNSGEVIDSGLMIVFPGPNSFTGEDVVELQVHGSRAVVEALSACLVDMGLHPAEAGAFTRRAFLNGRMDLTQAEGLGDLLAAETAQQHKLALGQAMGQLSAQIETLRGQVLSQRASLEALIDFSDEELEPGILERTRAALAAQAERVQASIAQTPRAERVRAGVKVVITGPPNVGKSSLLNALAQRDVAIVSGEAGTTRDSLDVLLNLNGYPVLLVDTAGLRETMSDVEREGIRRARAHVETADIVVAVSAPDVEASDDISSQHADIHVVNKSDIAPDTAGMLPDRALAMSLKTGNGLNIFIDRLATLVEERFSLPGDSLALNTRQASAMADYADAVSRASQELGAEDGDIVVAADHLRAASHALARVSGRADIEDVLGAIFGRFCIGK